VAVVVTDRRRARRRGPRAGGVFLRRFDLEQFRLFTQVLGWTPPKIATRPPRTGGLGDLSDAYDKARWPAVADDPPCAAPEERPARGPADTGQGPPPGI